jgi:hypothetical protein
MAYKKTFLKLLTSSLKYLVFSILRKDLNKKIYYARMSGIFNAMTGNSSWYRTNLNKNVDN